MFLAGASACEKNWVCSCNTSEGQVGIIIKDATKKEAEEVCQERAADTLLGASISRCILEGKYKKGKV
ncbi:MAG: hypothetical protein Salg2KO_22750 [Salibacteraceae bacterium]